MPRASEEDPKRIELTWEATWPSHLEAELWKQGNVCARVINCGARSRTVDSICYEDFYEHFVLKEPSCVVMQVGIVDCSPRIFSRLERRIIGSSYVPDSLRKSIISRRKRERQKLTAKNPLAKVYTSPDRFRGCLEMIAQKVKDLKARPKIIVLPIMAEPRVMENKSPGIMSNIRFYNQMLTQFTNGLEAELYQGKLISAPRPDLFWSDGYHLSSAGHALLASELSLIVEKWL